MTTTIRTTAIVGSVVSIAIAGSVTIMGGRSTYCTRSTSMGVTVDTVVTRNRRRRPFLRRQLSRLLLRPVLLPALAVRPIVEARGGNGVSAALLSCSFSLRVATAGRSLGIGHLWLRQGLGSEERQMTLERSFRLFST
jgi:hypothetical protein